MAGLAGGQKDFLTFNFTYSSKKRTGAMYKICMKNKTAPRD